MLQWLITILTIRDVRGCCQHITILRRQVLNPLVLAIIKLNDWNQSLSEREIQKLHCSIV